jgi:hypothetical protein
MRHLLWMKTEFGSFCAACGYGNGFVPELCDVRMLKEEVQELFHWQRNSSATNFTALLYDLFQKADAENTNKLAKAYPKHQAALTLWKLSEGEGDELFEAAGLIQPKEEVPEDEHGTPNGLGRC